MTAPKPEFAFVKELGISEILYGDIPQISNMIARLLFCMKETNQKHNVSCEFFRLDFRPQTFDEEITRKFPIGALVLDLKWGSKKELEKKNDNA